VSLLPAHPARCCCLPCAKLHAECWVGATRMLHIFIALLTLILCLLIRPGMIGVSSAFCRLKRRRRRQRLRWARRRSATRLERRHGPRKTWS
jgi:hypothetical protein